MGRVATKRIRNIAKRIILKYFPILTKDFEKNKRILNEIADFPSKRLRNRVAGYITRLMRTGRAEELWHLRKREQSL